MPDLLSHPLRILLLSLVLFFKTLCISGQTEYLVTVDPSDGSFIKIDSIPGVMWILLYYKTIVDEKNKQVIFVGGPTPTDFNLITLNATHGNTIYKVALPRVPTLIYLVYSKSLDKLYGIIINSGISSLVTVTKESCIYSLVKDIPGISDLNYFALDDANHRLFLKGLQNGSPVFLTIDILTGNITSQVPFPERLVHMAYDHLSNKLYALTYRIGDGLTSIFSVGIIDPVTGTYSIIADLPPEVSGLHPGNETYNEREHRYIFTAINNTGVASLYTVDAPTGLVIYKVPVPMGSLVDRDNLIQFRFDNSSGKLYALHWEARTITNPQSSCDPDIQIKIYPNPFDDYIIIKKNPTICTLRMNIYTTTGQLMIKNKIIKDGENQIQLKGFPSGLYFYTLYPDGNTLLTGKIIKQ